MLWVRSRTLYGPIDTPTADGKIAGNFRLTIEGTDVASGQEFHYQYDTSSQTVTFIPEPTTIGLAAVGMMMAVVSTLCRRELISRRGKKILEL